MLLNYEVNNFSVFKEKIQFDMKAGKTYSRFEDNVIEVHSKMKVSKVAVIVGENGSGKTYFMRSLDYLKYLIISNNNIRSIKNLCNNYNNEKSQKFKLEVVLDKKIYTYELEIDKFSKVFEKLSFRGYTLDKSKDVEIFSAERISVVEDKQLGQTNLEIGMKLDINEKFILEELKDKIKPSANGLFLNDMVVLGVEEVKTFVNWIENKLIVEMHSDIPLNIYKQMQEDEEDIEIMKSDEFLEIFRLVDSSIVNVEIDEKDPFRDTKIIRKKGKRDFKVSLKNDSSGVNEFFAWSIQIWKVIYENITLFADELDRVLNPILSARVLRFIKGSNHKGQFVFSTHNILHLNTTEFMKEQINFVSKDRYTLNSEFYSLGDFEEYKYQKTDVYNLYLKGLLGGVPND